MSLETGNHKNGMNMKTIQPTSYLRGNQIIKLKLNALNSKWLRLAASSPSTVRTHYQKDEEPVSRRITALGLDPASKRPSPKQ